MCFKNLPVEFDAAGRPYLQEGWDQAFSTSRTVVGNEGAPRQLSPDRIRAMVAERPNVQEFNVDPVTRVAGALAFHSVADLEERRVVEARSMATLFRGYEIILQGRDPRDANFISSRACGVCGGVHSVTSALACDMAFGVVPPPMGTVVRNLLLAAEFLYDQPLIFLLGMVDFSESAVRATNPEIWERARRTQSKYGDVHGFPTVADLMTNLNPLTGSLYLTALEVSRVAREMYVVLGGKYPHPQTIVPGGLTTTVTRTAIQDYWVRLNTFFDWSKKQARIADELTEFFYEVNPDYRKVGARPANMIDCGIWDDPDAYDATFENANEWGEARWSTPGVILDGELVTTRLNDMNRGIEEFVHHSFYDEWTDGRGGNVPYRADPGGGPISPYHMWNKQTLPRPGATSWKEKYSWDTAPRWDRVTMEAGAYARLWLTAVARKIRPNEFVEATGESLKLTMPKGELPEMTLEWKVPFGNWNAFERNRGRCYAEAFNAAVAMNNVLKAWELMKHGEEAVSTDYKIPKDERVSVGYWGAGRGYLSHHMVMDKGLIRNYQILTPSTWNASPIDPFGNPGAYEESVLNTPILENFERREDFKGIDVLRSIRSFDPCMPCTTHIADTTNTVAINREVTTCACGAEDE